MRLNNLIKKILKEETEEWVDVSPEDYKELLDYVNGDGAFIKNLPDYKGKKIKITGNLDLSGRKDIENIDSIDYVDGNLTISDSNISYFDKDKIKKYFSYHRSKMYDIEKRKIYEQQIEHQKELREEGAWEVENNDEESNETEAVYDYLLEKTIPEDEDKYFLYKRNYKNYGNSVYTWLGSNEFESEYIVYRDDKIHDAAVEELKSRIEELGFGTFRESVWEEFINERYVRDYLYEDYEEMISNNPEDWNINREFTQQQKQYLEIYQASIDRLNQKLEQGGLTDEEVEEIENDIYDYEQLIEDVNENPEGEYNEEEIEDAIENMVDGNVDNVFSELRNRGYDDKALLDFVDVDAAIDYVIQSDGYGSILNSYDGSDDEYKVNGVWYHVMRND